MSCMRLLFSFVVNGGMVTVAVSLPTSAVNAHVNVFKRRDRAYALAPHAFRNSMYSDIAMEFAAVSSSYS